MNVILVIHWHQLIMRNNNIEKKNTLYCVVENEGQT